MIPSDAIEIREVVPADAGAVGRLLDQFGYPLGLAELERRLARFSSDATVCLLVAEDAASTVGVGMLQTVEVLEGDGPLGMLLTLIVDRTARRRGVGTRLVEELERFARQQWCFGIVVQSGSRRIEAHSLYQGLGYEQTGERFLKIFDRPRS